VNHWEDLFEAAAPEDVRNDPNRHSFFVVTEGVLAKNDELYVSPDWPSAEAFASFARHELSKVRWLPIQGLHS
jgi:hypothetical protein